MEVIAETSNSKAYSELCFSVPPRVNVARPEIPERREQDATETKTQLRDELQQAKELAEVQAKTKAEVTAVRESKRKLQEFERHLKQVAELHRCATESERELNEATAELSFAQDKVEDLEASLREAQTRSRAGKTTEGGPDDLEVD